MDWVNECMDECKCAGHSAGQQKLLDTMTGAALDIDMLGMTQDILEKEVTNARQDS